MATRTSGKRAASARSNDQEPVDVPDGARVQHGVVVPHLSVEERIAAGKAARRQVPRSSHAEFTPSADRPDPVALLEQQASTRVPELVPIRYGRMLVSPFTFFRGGALLMANDLAGTPTSGLVTQVCGDAHLLNFGVFGTPERRLVFGINDFDETAPGPWEWDVKRLAASVVVAARDNGYSARACRRVVLETVQAYRTSMREFAAMRNLDVWYSRLDVDDFLQTHRAEFRASAMKRAESNVAKARTRDSMQALSKLTHVVDGRRRIVSDPPLIEPLEDLAGGADAEEVMAFLRTLLRGYRNTLQSDRRHLLEDFRLTHAARKVVGVGSVGMRSWILLMFGRDDNDPLILQAKEAQPSVLEAFVGPAKHSSNGERVVHGQHMMQTTSDIFLGWLSVDGPDGVHRDFFMRQLRDWKGAAEVEAMTPDMMATYARLCGWTLARAHARSGDRVAIAAYLGASDVFDQAIADFAEAYADQNERDYDALVVAERDGRVTALRGL